MSDFIDSLYRGKEVMFEQPITLTAKVIHGFKRGSKELGVPTANLSMDELGEKGNQLKTGIYFGYSSLHANVYSTVVSVGWNPYYKNEKKTVEAHLISQLDDFYDETLTVLLCGYLRDEANFKSLDELILAINTDIKKAQHYIENDVAVSKFSTFSTWPFIN